MPINSLPSRRASREKYHNRPSSRMRSILRLSKETFWPQPQHMVAKEILEKDYIPGYDDDSQELFKQKQYFMYSVLNKVLQSDMGKTIVRKYHHLWMHNQYGRNLRLIYPHHPKDSMKGIDCMPMFPLLSMIGHGKALLNNLFFISMNTLGN